MDVKGLQGRLAAFGAERGWDHSPKSLAMALAAEAGAVLGLFRWPGEAPGQGGEPVDARVPDAIADAVLHAFRLADRLGIDVEEALTRKLAQYAARYPVPERRAPAAPAATERRLAAKTQGLREELRQATSRLGTQKAVGGGTTARGNDGDARSHAAPPSPRRAPDAPEPAARAPAATPRAAPLRPAVPAAERAPVASPPSPAARASAPQRTAARPPAPPAAPAPPAPAAGPPSVPPEPDRFANLDAESAIGFLKSLSRRVDGARSDDPLLRELHDELQTLKRNLYSSNAKPAWIGTSLETIRSMLEEATRHSYGEEIRAAEHLVHVQSILNP